MRPIWVALGRRSDARDEQEDKNKAYGAVVVVLVLVVAHCREKEGRDVRQTKTSQTNSSHSSRSNFFFPGFKKMCDSIQRCLHCLSDVRIILDCLVDCIFFLVLFFLPSLPRLASEGDDVVVKVLVDAIALAAAVSALFLRSANSAVISARSARRAHNSAFFGPHRAQRSRNSRLRKKKEV